MGGMVNNIILILMLSSSNVIRKIIEGEGEEYLCRRRIYNKRVMIGTNVKG